MFADLERLTNQRLEFDQIRKLFGYHKMEAGLDGPAILPSLMHAAMHLPLGPQPLPITIARKDATGWHPATA